MHIVGRPELIEEPWFANHTGRVEHADELDEIIQTWIGDRTTDEVLDAFAEAEGAIAPIYSIAEIFDDPQYKERGTIATVEHPVLGPLKMPNVIPRMGATPGRIKHAGAELGEHNHEIFCKEFGVSEAELAELSERGVI